MGNILWSVDKKIYSDKENHTLAITGWAITRDQSECDFILYGSGKELSVPEPSRCERADVAKDLKDVTVDTIEDQTATGAQIKPGLVVKNGNVLMKEGVDYQVTYGTNTGSTTRRQQDRT